MQINLDLIKDIKKLKNTKVGTQLYLSGKLYTARDAAHKKIFKIIKSHKKFPLSLNNAIIYYMGPSPTREGYPIGSCGPTSSYRMDDLLELTLQLGVIATIGKGQRKEFVNDLVKKYQAPYLVTIGGVAAYLAECVISSKIVLFKELGTEAMRELIVKDFPVIVGIDIWGKNIFIRN